LEPIQEREHEDSIVESDITDKNGNGVSNVQAQD